jgi:hypothetical protein
MKKTIGDRDFEKMQSFKENDKEKKLECLLVDINQEEVIQRKNTF